MAKIYWPRGRQSVHQFSKGTTFTYNIHLGCMIACWKELYEEYKFCLGKGHATIDTSPPNIQNTFFRALKQPEKFETQKSYKKC